MSVNADNNELTATAFSIASSMKSGVAFTQQRIIEGKMSVISLDRSWVWYDDIKDGFIFSSAAGDIPLCISIMDSGSPESSIPANASAGKAKWRFMAGNTPIDAEYFEVISGSAIQVYINTLLQGNLFTIHISTSSDKIKTADELLGHELVTDFFIYNAVFN